MYLKQTRDNLNSYPGIALSNEATKQKCHSAWPQRIPS